MDVSLQAMAPKKLFSKKARKEATGEGSSMAPQADMEFDGHPFRSKEHQHRFEAIKSWFFLKEGQVQLREGEYVEFQEEIARRRWTQLVGPMAKYDLEIAMEFYSNACPIEEGVKDKRSWVRGQWVSFDEDDINQFLGHPLVLEEGQRCEFSERRSQALGFHEEAIGQILCVPGHDLARSVTGRRVRIMRISMTTLTQI